MLREYCVVPQQAQLKRIPLLSDGACKYNLHTVHSCLMQCSCCLPVLLKACTFGCSCTLLYLLPNAEREILKRRGVADWERNRSAEKQIKSLRGHFYFPCIVLKDLYLLTELDRVFMKLVYFVVTAISPLLQRHLAWQCVYVWVWSLSWADSCNSTGPDSHMTWLSVHWPSAGQGGRGGGRGGGWEEELDPACRLIP